jgi:hypothetical protein
MKQSPSWETNSHSANQEIPCISWNLKVHYHVHKSPPLLLFYISSFMFSELHPITRLSDIDTMINLHTYEDNCT